MLLHLELAYSDQEYEVDDSNVTNQLVGTIASAAQELVRTPSTPNFIATRSAIQQAIIARY